MKSNSGQVSCKARWHIILRILAKLFCFTYSYVATNKLEIIRSYLSGRGGIYYILGALIVLVVSDSLLSRFLVRNRLGWEWNPFLQRWVGEDTFVVIKALGVLLCALILWDIHRRHPKLALIASLCFTVLYAGIVLWNLIVLFITQV